jgi:hypothetical protein
MLDCGSNRSKYVMDEWFRREKLVMQSQVGWGSKDMAGFDVGRYGIDGRKEAA